MHPRDGLHCRRLAELAAENGVWRNDLPKIISDELREHWGIDLQEQNPETVRAYVVANLRRLVHHHIKPVRPSNAAAYKRSVMASFNMFDLAELRHTTPTARRKWVQNQANAQLCASEKSSRTWLAHAIEQIEQILVSGQYAPVAVNKFETLKGELPTERKNILQLGASTENDMIKCENSRPAAHSSGPHSGTSDAETEVPPRLPRFSTPPIVNRRIPHIPRPEYATEFETRLNRGDKIIPFVGEPGNGKSRLADFLIDKHLTDGQTRIGIRVDNLSHLRVYLISPLERFGKPQDTDADTKKIIENFAIHLYSEDAPDYLFIDNLEEAELFKDIVPEEPRHVVVVTSREPVVPPERAELLPVRPMEDDEAKNLTCALLPTITDQDITSLIAKLGNRPLAIEHVCKGLLEDGFMTVDEVCAEFDHDAGRLMEQAKKPIAQTFTWIYTKILARLHEIDSRDKTHMAPLLELMAFVAPEAIPVDLVRDALLSLEVSPTKLTKAAFQAAQRELQARYLIEHTASGFRIHGLTQSVLRSILTGQEKEASLCLHLHGAVRTRLCDEDLHQTVDAISIELIPWLPHIFSVVSGVGSLDRACHREIDFAHTLAVLIRGLGFIADFQDIENCQQCIHVWSPAAGGKRLQRCTRRT